MKEESDPEQRNDCLSWLLLSSWLHLLLTHPNLFLLQKVRFSSGAAPSMLPQLTRRCTVVSVHHALLWLSRRAQEENWMRGWAVCVKGEKKTQLCERVTHLHLSQALRNWLTLIGCYCEDTRVCSNTLWSHPRVFSGFVFCKSQSSRCEI